MYIWTVATYNIQLTQWAQLTHDLFPGSYSLSYGQCSGMVGHTVCSHVRYVCTERSRSNGCMASYSPCLWQFLYKFIYNYACAQAWVYQQKQSKNNTADIHGLCVMKSYGVIQQVCYYSSGSYRDEASSAPDMYCYKWCKHAHLDRFWNRHVHTLSKS